jgi:hypothetical protein
MYVVATVVSLTTIHEIPLPLSSYPVQQDRTRHSNQQGTRDTLQTDDKK